MSGLQALASGAVGAITLNVIHESARRAIPEAPRVHRVAMRAIARPMRRIGRQPPSERKRYLLALGGDLVLNALYYSMIGIGRPRRSLARGAALGLAGGIAAVALPGPMGLGSEPVARTPATAAMTIAWYTLGGIAAAGAFALLRSR